MLDKNQRAKIIETIDQLYQNRTNLDSPNLADHVNSQAISIQSLDQLKQISSQATTLFKQYVQYVVDDLMIINPNRIITDKERLLLYENGLIESNETQQYNLTERNSTQNGKAIQLSYRGFKIGTSTVGRDLFISGYRLTPAGKALCNIMNYHDEASQNRILRQVNEFIGFLITLPSFKGSYRFDIYQMSDNQLRYVEEVIIEHN